MPLLVPPVAWTASLGLSWLVQDFTCTAAITAGAPVPGTALLATLLAINTVLLVVTAGSGVVSVRDYRAVRDAQASLLRFLALTGAILAVFFAYGIVLIGAMPLVMEVC